MLFDPFFDTNLPDYGPLILFIVVFGACFNALFQCNEKIGVALGVTNVDKLLSEFTWGDYLVGD